jgi:hypothetical protein
MPPADNTPNFDKMSPEEIMAWMESLAKRQGANEGFTTAADVEVPEIDPDTVVIDEPGYVPSEGKMRGQKIGPGVPIKKVEAPPPPPPAPEPVVIKPVAPPPPPPAPVRQVELPIEPAPVVQRPAARAPEPPPVAPVVERPAARAPEPPPAPAPAAPAAQGTLSWLESLAADQGNPLDFSLDAFAAPKAAASAPSVSTTDWLADLAGASDLTSPAESEQMLSEPASAAAAPATDTVSWLETLAARQGAAPEELVAPAAVDIPLPAEISSDEPGYTDYAFDSPTLTTRTGSISAAVLPEPFVAEEAQSPEQDAAAWLDQLAAAQKPAAAAPAPMDDGAIQAALARGENIPHDEMEAWMQRQLQIGAKRPDPEIGDPDAEDSAVPAVLPDWLLEQAGPPPPLDAAPPAAPAQPALIEAIFDPPAVQSADLPDWLREESDNVTTLDDIFATSEQEEVQLPPTVTIAPGAGLSAVDMNDPWVEALEVEYQAAHGGVIPAPVEVVTAAPAIVLTAATLPPETDLAPGELEAAPDWLSGLVPEAVAPILEADPEQTAVVNVDPAAIRAAEAEALPDWLNEVAPAFAGTTVPAPAGASTDEISNWLETIELEPAEIPAWLTETINPPAAPPAPEPAPVAPAAAAVPAAAPVVARIASVVVNAVEALTRARSRYTENDLDASLNEYDSLVRSNQSLDEVVGDLTKAVEKHKGNPTVYRVLGDGLMRQGKLQAALDTYRKALNQL